MIRSDPRNVWKLRTAKGEIHYVKCPSKSGAKIFLAEKIGIAGNTPFKSELCVDVPEGMEILQAAFRAADDPMNWAEGKV